MLFQTGDHHRANRRVRIVALGVVLAAVGIPMAYADPSPPPPASVTDVNRSYEQLQAEAAALQADFAKATIAYTKALGQSQQADAVADKAELLAAQAKAKADEQRGLLGQLTAQAYQLGLPLAFGPQQLMWAQSPFASNLPQFADRQTAIAQVGSDQAKLYETVTTLVAAANVAAADATAKRQVANQAAANAKVLDAEVRRKAASASVTMQGQLADLAGAKKMSAQLQKSRNDQAKSRWQTYLAELAAAGVKPPKAAALRDPAKLPKGLQPLKDSTGAVIRGAASVVDGGRTIRVLPAETIKAVTAAFGIVAKKYGVSGTGPGSFGCLGATRTAWKSYTALPSPIDKVYASYQKVSPNSIQPGDVIVMGNGSTGLWHIGVAIDNSEMIAADETKKSVVVTAIPESFFAAVRPTLGKPASPQVAPATTAAAEAFRCGATQTSYDVGSGQWTWPLDDGTYEIGTPFGQPGGLWITGVHTGQDFPAPLGTAVHAVTGGVVSVEHPSWAGNLVRIDHGNGIETLYAHLSSVAVSPGSTVVPGQVIGAVGSEGNSTGAHLHFEVRSGGDPVNPMPFLATGGLSNGGDSFGNGLIPVSELCVATTGHRLRCDAASAYKALATAYQAHFGRKLCITDSYRSYDSQVSLYQRKPSLAALPGTSNHGWGIAVDLCGGADKFGTSQHRWLLSNAGNYGWKLPRWARQGGSKPEPWHWEFTGA
ncbi:peptidoglycan DD-metalloendopeptidase family protein [Kribbella sp. NBC_01245]|uniref:peptidoglycan DD-metalloendopeptidase family protein n=1 Tax=Kribbella sp. NBC_01245 TaxID=2903578 RepID=UPI002E2AF722|nr:peptidoglycan DD-metalloendopeptidase family protein [Kribbella sp. NBC_01245]